MKGRGAMNSKKEKDRITIKERILTNKIIIGLKNAVNGIKTLLEEGSGDEVSELNFLPEELRKASLRVDKLGDMTVEATGGSEKTSRKAKLSPEAVVSEQDALNELYKQYNSREERTRTK